MYIPFSKVHNIGFISTRFPEPTVFPWKPKNGPMCSKKNGFIASILPENWTVIRHILPGAQAHFMEPEIRTIFNTAFGSHANGVRERSLTTRIHEIKEHLKDQLYDFIAKFNIDLLVPENALTIPLNIPLGLAITEVIAETGLPTIAHHHDFFWERQEFKTNSVWDYLNMAFPPHLPTIRHVVISSSADNQLSLRPASPPPSSPTSWISKSATAAG
jgi:hypothetical protein